MTPPKAPEAGTASQTDQPSAVSVCENEAQTAPVVVGTGKMRAGLGLLTKRREFLDAARARRQGSKGMMVQGLNRHDEGGVRAGFTCSKKVGNAVARNRAKRRLREVARLVLPKHGRPGWDYVLIGRAEQTAARDFQDLQNDLIYALKKIHGK